MTKEEITNAIYMANDTTRILIFQSWVDNKLIAGPLYWYALALAYTNSDNTPEHRPAIWHAFNSKEPGRENLMNEEEKESFEKLPEIITIYRGMTEVEYDSGNFGVSWTLDKKVADFFTSTYRKNRDANKRYKTIQLTISKQKALAYFTGREEAEIIYLHAGPVMIS